MMPRYSIVLADDHIMVRQGIRRIIEEALDLEVVAEAGDGLELMEILRNRTVHLVIVDISMPNISGIEATKRIKALYPKIKVLILTMHKGKELLDHAIAAGADGYLLKLDASKELINAIAAIRRGEIYMSPLIVSYIKERYILNHRHAARSDILSARETEIVKLIAEGKSSKEIGGILCLSTRTVDNHRTKIMKKLNINKNIDLVRYALSMGYLDT